MDYIFKALFAFFCRTRSDGQVAINGQIFMIRPAQIVFKSYCSDCDTRLWAVLDCSWGRAGARDRAIASLDITLVKCGKSEFVWPTVQKRGLKVEREIDGKVGHLLEGCVISSRGCEQGKSKPDRLSRNKEKFWFQSMDTELLELLM